MEVITRDYGTVEVREESIIHFDMGIIGFEEYRDYVLLDADGGDSPFKCLQSLDESGLAFILLDPFAIKPDYEISLDDDLIKRLGLDGEGDIVILAITVVPQDISKTTFNLKAPIVVNANTRMGEQYIVDRDDYKVRHSVLDEIEGAKKIGLQNGKTAV